MLRSKLVYFSVAFGCLGLSFTALQGASAGPIGVVSASVLEPLHSITDIRYRRRIQRRRGGGGPAAVIGLFGAMLGGVIANQRYDNYSADVYGQPYDYGYSPGYVSGPVYRGGGRGNFGGRGGGGRAVGGGVRGGGGRFGGGGARVGDGAAPGKH